MRFGPQREGRPSPEPPPPSPTDHRKVRRDSGGFGPAVLGHNAAASRPSRKMLYVGCHTYVTLSSLLMVLSHGSTDTLGGAIAPCFFCLLHPSAQRCPSPPPSASLEFRNIPPNISKRKDRERASEAASAEKEPGGPGVHKGRESSSSTRAWTGWTGASKKSRDRGLRATEPAGWVGDQNINWRELLSF